MTSCVKQMLLGLIAAMILGPSTSSALVIDTFDDNSAPALNLTVISGGAPATNFQAAVTGTVSGNRNAKLTVLAGAEDTQATMRIAGPAVNRVLILGSEPTVTAQWELDYVPLAGIDITEGGIGTAIAMHFISADHGATVTATIDVPGPGTLTQTLAKAVGPGDLLFDFSAFLPSSITPATIVNGIHFTILGETDGDYQIEFIDTTTNTVPEPSTFALAGLGLLGLAGVCWKRFGRKHCG